MQEDATLVAQPAQPWLVGGGAMGQLILSMDWSGTALGPIESWPPSLRTTVSLVLNSNFPISLAWGPSHIQIYNDGYWPICGDKHPTSMGQDFSECWASAFPVIGDAFHSALAGTTAYLQDQRMFLDRLGFLEETFFTFSFSPIRDETGAVAGLFHPVTETTSRILSERRARTLRDLAALDTRTLSVDQALRLVADTLAESANDVPFALFYRVNPEGTLATLAAQTGLTRDTEACPATVALTQPGAAWALDLAAAQRTRIVLEDVAERCAGLVAGPYPEPVRAAFVHPILLAGPARLSGLMVTGISTRLPMTEPYRAFFDLLAGAVAARVANATAFAEERERANALAELDRAKTAFFSNVSHEFRTPLTLLLGTLEEELAAAPGLAGPGEERLRTAHRNALRLLKLVNTLLDFARLEAGRIQADFTPADLAALTADLAGNFRSACERAGLRFTVDCPPLSRPVQVDLDMWEKIILNLLSNAFKFTLAGGIEVALRETAGSVELTVRDTGAGIPAEELPRVFERFHRIKDTPGRSYEGTGIGLALTRELIHLQGGTIKVESVPGQGSLFTVSLPRTAAPAGPGAAPRTSAPQRGLSSASPFLEEALQWLPDPPAATGARLREPGSQTGEPGRPRIVLADDNADMRRHILRLLGQAYAVEAVADGEEALAAIRRNPPALVLSDIMMPRLDGFGLLRELRGDERLHTIPVILLSARAGEEERIRGLEVGADDYLTKPFTARDLQARVRAHVELAQLRLRAERDQVDEALRDSERKFRNLAEAMPQIVWITQKDGLNTYFNQQWVEYTGLTLEQSYGDGWVLPFHPDDRRRAWDAWQLATRTAGSYAVECRLRRADGAYRWWLIRGVPQTDGAGAIVQWFGTCTDIEDMKRQETALRLSEENLAVTLDCIGDGVIVTDTRGRVSRMNPAAERLTGWTLTEAAGRALPEVFRLLDASTQSPMADPVTLALDRGEAVGLANHAVLVARDGRHCQISDSAAPIRTANGETIGVVLVFSDVTQEYQMRQSLAATVEMLNRTGAIARIGGWELDLATMGLVWSLETYRIHEVEPQTPLTLAQAHAFYAPEARPQLMAMLQRGIDQGTSWSYELPLTTAQGRPLWVRGQGSAIQSAGKTVRLVGTLQDVTERRRAEEERRQLEAQLLRSQKMDSLGSLAGGVAHDMNNVLAAILALSLVHQKTAGADAQLRRDLETIAKACQRGGHMVKGLLSFARHELVEEREVDLNAIIREEIVLLERTTLQKVRLVMELDPGLPRIKGDPAALHHSLMNLCVNAVDAMEEGGALTLRTGLAADGGVLLEVEDTGTGMAKEVLDKAMEPFFTTKAHGKGTGLGLSIVYGIVKTHGGRMELHSELGQGSQVRLCFPALPPHREAPSLPQEAAPAAPRKGLNILLVDDDDLILASVPLLLQALGHTLATASNGLEALRRLEAGYRPDVVFLDMNMPGLGGGETLARLRELCPTVPVLLATGRADQRALDLVSSHARVALLSKPFDLEEVQRCLDWASRGPD